MPKPLFKKAVVMLVTLIAQSQLDGQQSLTVAEVVVAVAVMVDMVVVEEVALLAEDRVVVDSLTGEVVVVMAVATGAVAVVMEAVARMLVMGVVAEDTAVVKRGVMALHHVAEVGAVAVEDTEPLKLVVIVVNRKLDMVHRLRMMDTVKHPLQALQVDTVPLQVMVNNPRLQLLGTTVTDRLLADTELLRQPQLPRQVTVLLAQQLATEGVQLPLVLLDMVVVMVSPVTRQLLRLALEGQEEVMDNRWVLPLEVMDSNQLQAVNQDMDNQRLQVPVTVPNRVVMVVISSCIASKLPQKLKEPTSVVL